MHSLCTQHRHSHILFSTCLSLFNIRCSYSIQKNTVFAFPLSVYWAHPTCFSAHSLTQLLACTSCVHSLLSHTTIWLTPPYPIPGFPCQYPISCHWICTQLQSHLWHWPRRVSLPGWPVHLQVFQTSIPIQGSPTPCAPSSTSPILTTPEPPH